MQPNQSQLRSVIPWRAQPGPQLTAIRHHNIDEVFYGGAVGGGKSDFLLGDFAQDVPQPWGAHWKGILFRQSYGELEELISRSQEIYPPWFPGCEWKESDKTWEWPNGAALKLRYMESTKDWMRYWGHQYTWIGWDELPNWANLTAYEKMKARLRSAHPVPNKRIRSTGNPGGQGHHAVKEYFRIDEYPLGGVVFDGTGGMKRMFIRSRLIDNRILVENDPNYGIRLAGLPLDMRRALLDGDWNVVAGAFFDCWSDDRHIVQPFVIPDHWMKIRGADWGSASPFCILWATIASETYQTPKGDIIPKGCIVIYREWYGSKANDNVGLKLPAEMVAEGIKERELGEKIDNAVMDPSAFNQDGGPSHAERMAERGVIFRRADNRIQAQKGAWGGWDMLRMRLMGDDDGLPMMVVFPTCKNLIRTLPSLQHDPDKPEQAVGEDHAPDTARYIAMSRPWVKPAPKKPEPFKGWESQTIDQLWEDHHKRLGGE